MATELRYLRLIVQTCLTTQWSPRKMKSRGNSIRKRRMTLQAFQRSNFKIIQIYRMMKDATVRGKIFSTTWRFTQRKPKSSQLTTMKIMMMALRFSKILCATSSYPWMSKEGTPTFIEEIVKTLEYDEYYRMMTVRQK